MSIFEIGMLVCFGAAWPFSIWKSAKTKNVSGKSLIFLLIVLLGYVLGVLHKLFFNLDAVVYLYAVNGILVLIDISFYLRYRERLA